MTRTEEMCVATREQQENKLICKIDTCTALVWVPYFCVITEGLQRKDTFKSL
jgi:hypothetical protein